MQEFYDALHDDDRSSYLRSLARLMDIAPTEVSRLHERFSLGWYMWASVPDVRSDGAHLAD